MAGVSVCWIPAELGPIEPVDDIEGDGIGWARAVRELRPGEVERARNGTGSMDMDVGAARTAGAGLAWIEGDAAGRGMGVEALSFRGEVGVIGVRAPGIGYSSTTGAGGAIGCGWTIATLGGSGDEEGAGVSNLLSNPFSAGGGGGGGESGSGIFVASGTLGKVSFSAVAVGNSSSK